MPISSQELQYEFCRSIWSIEVIKWTGPENLKMVDEDILPFPILYKLYKWKKNMKHENRTETERRRNCRQLRGSTNKNIEDIG